MLPTNFLFFASMKARVGMVQGILAATSFSLLLAGTNANTPLLPVYRTELNFSPLTMSLTFVSYVLVLIIFLLILSRPSIVTRSRTLLCVALLFSIASDMFLATATEHGIMIGRALSGVAVGIGTAPAAAIVVSAFGLAGRSLSATGNLVGAVAGTALSQLSVAAFPADVAMTFTFKLHAGAAAVVLSLFILTLTIKSTTFRPLSVAAASTACRISPIMRRQLRPLLMGTVGWVTISLSITFLPSFLQGRGLHHIQAYGIIVMLASCAMAQLGGRRVSLILQRINGLEIVAIGLVLILVCAATQSEMIGGLGLAMIGAGIGLSYRLGLVIITGRANPTEHGALSSVYAAVTYGAAAAAVVTVGLAGSIIGLDVVTMSLLAVLSLACVTVSVTTPKLGEELR